MSDGPPVEQAGPGPGDAGPPGGTTVGVLGPVVLLDGDDQVLAERLGGPKQRLVLSVLVAEAGRVVPVDRLVRRVWGEDADRGTRRSLRAYVSRLRGLLAGAASIEHRHGGYVLQAVDVASDAQQFERLVDAAAGRAEDDPGAAAAGLRAALRLWRGPPFGDLTREPGLSAEVARLQRLRMRAMEQLAGIELDRDGHDRVVPELRQLVADHPLREPLRRLLMLALYRSGRQGEALEEYERLRHTLAEELGADPSRPLQELHAAILRQDPSLEPAVATVAADELAVVTVGEAPMSTGAMVGRDRELARITDLLETTRTSGSQLLLVAGEAGVGKSRLLGEAAVAAREAGVGVLVGHCMQLGDATLPFAPVGEVLRRLTRGATEDRLQQLLGPARHDLARILPGLGDAPPATDADVPGRLFTAVRDALARVADRQPLLVVLEDVHWADRSTLDLIGYLARSLDRQRLVLALTFRTDELDRDHPLRGVIGELSRLPNVTRVDLEPLDREEVAALVAEVLGEVPRTAFVDDVAARSSGNPFYVEELVAAARDGVPSGLGAGLRDVLTSRLDRLPAGSRRLVEVAAIAGGKVEQELLAVVAAEEPTVLTSHLRPAVERHVLVADATTLQFRHDLVREAVVDDLLPGERAVLHTRVAGALERYPRLASGGADQADAELAHHWYAAGDDQRAFDASLRAGDRARRAGAYAEAMRLDERALELWDDVDRPDGLSRPAMLAKAADAARLAGRYEHGLDLMRRALGEARGDVEQEADLRRSLALMLIYDARDVEAALTEAKRALELVADQPPSPRQARIVHTVARMHLLDGDDGRTIDLGREAIAIARSVGDEAVETDARITVGTALTRSGQDVETGLVELRESLRIARARGDVRSTHRAYTNLILAHGVSLQLDASRRIAEEALAWLDGLDRGPSPTVDAHLRINVAATMLLTADWDRAGQVLDDLAEQDLEGFERYGFLNNRAELHRLRGRLDDARQDAEEVLASGVGGQSHWASLILALVAAEGGAVDDVRRIVEQQRPLVTADTAPQVSRLGAIRLLAVLVRAEVDAALATTEAADREDHLDRADRALDDLLEQHELLRDPHVHVAPRTAHHARAALLMATAERTRAGASDPDRWQAVVDHAIPGHDHVYATWRLAGALLAADDPRGAAELVTAHRTAARLGAGLLLERIARTAADEGIDLEDPSPTDQGDDA